MLSLGASESSTGNSHANGTGPVNDQARFFNPYPIARYATS